MTGPAPEPVAVLGAGSIGVAFAIVFARNGSAVSVYDPVSESRERARAELDERLHHLERHALLPEPAGEVADRVRFTDNLAASVATATFVQECAPERVELKRELLSDSARHARSDAVFASATSAILPSLLAAGLPDAVATRIVVGHPGNPPYLLPVIEVVASPRTAADVVERALSRYRAAGLRPITVQREVEGFVFNRLQGAVLREAYCLLRDGVATVDDIDEVVRSGLGRRWSIMGPFETVDLNTRGGIESHAAKMGPAYARMGAERGQHDPWTSDLVATATAQRRTLLDSNDWAERVRWRDDELMRLHRVWGD